MPKNWCLWTVVLEKTSKSPLDSKEIKPVYLKGDQPWLFTGRTDAEAEASVFWSSDANRWLIGKVPDAGKDGGQKEEWVSEDRMAGWDHWCSEHELGQAPGGGRDREARHAAVHGIPKSRTQLGERTTAANINTCPSLLIRDLLECFLKCRF